MTLLKQCLIIALGLLAAGGMAVLGVWQLDVYHSQGTVTAAQRAAAPPVELLQVAPAGATVADGYGRSVVFSGRYDVSLQLLVPLKGETDRYRVLTGMRLADGSVVPVVRGLVRSPEAPPPPPPGRLSQTGVLLPSEDNEPVAGTGDTQLSSVRLPSLAQQWTGALVGGFVTLSAPDAQAQSLEPAPVVLPPGRGRLRNGAYALQWWIFGAFAVAMSIRIARDVARHDDLLLGAVGSPAHPEAGPGLPADPT